MQEGIACGNGFTRLVSAPKLLDRADDHILLLGGHLVEKRQANQPVGDALGHGAIARLAAELPAHRRKVQRQVVKDRRDSP